MDKTLTYKRERREWVRRGYMLPGVFPGGEEREVSETSQDLLDHNL